MEDKTITTKETVDYQGITLDKDLMDSVLKENPSESEVPAVGNTVQENDVKTPKSTEDILEGKNTDELRKMVLDAQSHISKLQSERDKKPERSKLEELNINTKALEDKVARLEETSANRWSSIIDQSDTDYLAHLKELNTSKAKLAQMKEELHLAKIEDRVNQTMYKSHNKEFIAAERNRISSELQTEVSDEVWDAVSDIAINIAGTGNKVTSDDIDAALIKTVGVENYRKYLSAVTTNKVRSDIKQATNKTMPYATPSGDSKDYSKLSETQLSQLLVTLHKQDHKKYQELKNKILGY